MVLRSGVLGLALVILLLFAACQPITGRIPKPAPDSAPLGATASPPPNPASPVRSTVRDTGAGGVTIEATWLGLQDDGRLAFRVMFDTHTVDLSRFDAAANVMLHDEKGRELRASGWRDERRDSHHRAGIVRFPAPPPSDASRQVTLAVHNLAGVPVRALTFEFQR